MLPAGVTVLLVAAVAAVVLGALLLGLWRRARALLAELGELGRRLEEARAAAGRVGGEVGGPDLGTTLDGHLPYHAPPTPGHRRP